MRVTLRSRRTRRRRDDAGQALVEFIMVFPLLFALICGLIEFGWYINAHDAIAAAARQGARLVASSGTTAGAVAEVDAEVRGASFSVADTSVSARITGSPDPSCAETLGGTYVVESAQVSVHYDYHPLFPFLRSAIFFGLDNAIEPNITATAIVPVEEEWSPGQGPCA